MSTRLVLSVPPDLLALLRERASEALAPSVQEYARRVLADHALGKCGGVPVPPEASSKASGRGRGRPRGGSKENEAVHKAIMEGDPVDVIAALEGCGFIPAGAKECVQGDPDKPAEERNIMFDEPVRELIYEVEPVADQPGELAFIIVSRTWENDMKDYDDARSVRTKSRAELWNIVKKEL